MHHTSKLLKKHCDFNFWSLVSLILELFFNSRINKDEETRSLHATSTYHGETLSMPHTPRIDRIRSGNQGYGRDNMSQVFEDHVSQYNGGHVNGDGYTMRKFMEDPVSDMEERPV